MSMKIFKRLLWVFLGMVVLIFIGYFVWTGYQV